MLFSERDIKKIAAILGAEAKHRGNNHRLVLENAEAGRRLSIEIYPEVHLDKNKKNSGSLVSVFTPTAHLQLHFCTGFVVSKMLGEVTFIAEHRGKISGLIVEKETGCSLFANVDNRVLSGDLTSLSPELMPASIALSLAETLLPESKPSRKKTTPESKKNGKRKTRKAR